MRNPSRLDLYRWVLHHEGPESSGRGDLGGVTGVEKDTALTANRLRLGQGLACNAVRRMLVRESLAIGRARDADISFLAPSLSPRVSDLKRNGGGVG